MVSCKFEAGSLALKSKKDHQSYELWQSLNLQPGAAPKKVFPRRMTGLYTRPRNSCNADFRV